MPEVFAAPAAAGLAPSAASGVDAPQPCAHVHAGSGWRCTSQRSSEQVNGRLTIFLASGCFTTPCSATEKFVMKKIPPLNLLATLLAAARR